MKNLPPYSEVSQMIKDRFPHYILLQSPAVSNILARGERVLQWKNISQAQSQVAKGIINKGFKQLFWEVDKDLSL